MQRVHICTPAAATFSVILPRRGVTENESTLGCAIIYNSHRSPQSSAFSFLSVLLVLTVKINARGNSDAAKVIESFAPKSLERIWRCVHGQCVKQSLHFHHLCRECLDSALETSFNWFFWPAWGMEGKHFQEVVSQSHFTFLKNSALGCFWPPNEHEVPAFRPFIAFSLGPFISEISRPNLYAIFKNIISLICIRTYFPYCPVFLFSTISLSHSQ